MKIEYLKRDREYWYKTEEGKKLHVIVVDRNLAVTPRQVTIRLFTKADAGDLIVTEDFIKEGTFKPYNPHSNDPSIADPPMPYHTPKEVVDYCMSEEEAEKHKICGEDAVPMFTQICTDMIKLHEAKNHDYGNSFDKSMDEFGLVAPAIRLSDKLNRFKSLIKSEAKVKDESIEDTLQDLACYSVMALAYIRTHKDK